MFGIKNWKFKILLFDLNELEEMLFAKQNLFKFLIIWIKNLFVIFKLIFQLLIRFLGLKFFIYF